MSELVATAMLDAVAIVGTARTGDPMALRRDVDQAIDSESLREIVATLAVLASVLDEQSFDAVAEFVAQAALSDGWAT